MILWKRKAAISWLVLIGLVAGFLLVGWLVLPTGEPFWQMAKGLTAAVAVASPAIRYLRRTPADRRKLRELKDVDKRLDEIERNGS